MKGNQKLEVRGTLTASDYRRHSNYNRKKMKNIYFIASLLMFFFVIFQSLEGPLLFVMGLTMIIALLLAIAMSFFLSGMISIRATRDYKNDPVSQHEIQYTFRAGNIKQKLKNSTNDYQWTDIIAAFEQEELFQLYVARNHAMILPKRFFKSEEEVEQLRELIEKNAKSAKVDLLKS
ncbi:YcxB family protein [Halobacillus sp. Marseille-Q1614]|uniref:YcxB family protein n=1 Tax=Halobacillus sp. Marseille-Q1614 TaxID=2709134 RepID=UPI00157158BD|nr:YcxB family protein [Halobacillus sp. Marseille-Q1614]